MTLSLILLPKWRNRRGLSWTGEAAWLPSPGRHQANGTGGKFGNGGTNWLWKEQRGTGMRIQGILYTWSLGQGTLELNMWGREGSGFWRQIHWWLHLWQTLDQRIQQALPMNKEYLRDVLIVGQVTLICCVELLVWICLCDYNFMCFDVSALLILLKAYIIKDRFLTLYFVYTASDGKAIVKWQWIFWKPWIVRYRVLQCSGCNAGWFCPSEHNFRNP